MHSNTFPLRSRLDGTIFPPGKRSRPSEGQLAECFAAAHHRELGYLSAIRGRKAGWIVWSDGQWQPDRLNIALRLAREVCAEASADCGDPSLDAYRTAAAVLALAKCDPRIAVQDWPLNPDILDALETWLAGPVEANPDGFLPLAICIGRCPKPMNGTVAKPTPPLKPAASFLASARRREGFAGVKPREERR